MLAGACWDLLTGLLLRRLIQILGRTSASLPRLEDILLRLLSCVLSTQWVPECVLEHLVLEVGNLALLVTICGAFNGGSERAIIFVPRPYRHIIEAAVRDSRHSNFIHSSTCSTRTKSILHGVLTHVVLTLVDRDCELLFNTGSGFDALFTAYACPGSPTTITSLIVPRLLQLLTLFQIAQLVIMRDEQVAPTV